MSNLRAESEQFANLNLEEILFNMKTDLYSGASYLPIGDKMALNAIDKEIARSLIDTYLAGDISSIQVEVRALPALDSAAGFFQIDLPGIAKTKRSLEVQFGDAIGKAFIVPQPDISVPEQFRWSGRIAIIGFEMGGSQRVATRSRANELPAIPSEQFQARHFDNLDEDTIRNAVDLFSACSSKIVRNSRTLFGQNEMTVTPEINDRCRIGLLQYKTLVQLKSAFVSAGLGVQIVKRALIEPNSVSTLAKREGGPRHSQMVHEWWLHYSQDPTHRLFPPLI